MAEEIKIEEIENDKKETSFVFRLEEMCDAIKASKDNLIKIRNEQDYLITKLKSLNDDKFVELIESIEKQNADFNTQELKLTNKIENMSKVIEQAKSDKAYENFLNTFICAIGMFDSI